MIYSKMSIYEYQNDVKWFYERNSFLEPVFLRRYPICNTHMNHIVLMSVRCMIRKC